ncbi:membrane fusion protein, multidrug efflux system [bacterium A37T11]|nr:membrane fusion protein, multidrug efflux system [bacterium A37T11]
MKQLMNVFYLLKSDLLLNSVRWFNIVNRLFLFFLVAFLVGCTAAGNQSPTDAAPTLPVVKLAKSDRLVDKEYPASIEGTVQVEIRPQVSGILETIFVDEGAKVTKGQALFKIDDKPYQEQYNNALANQHAAEAALENAKLEVEKKTQLVNNKVLSDFQLRSAIAAKNVAQSNVEQAKAGVATAKINLGYTTIRASVGGYIGRLPIKQGSLVGPTDPQPLTALSDIHEIHVYFSLGENDFIDFKSQYEGQTLDEKIAHVPPVTLLLSDNTPHAELGHIDMVDGQFDKNTGSITLRATFPNKEGLLRAGNTGRIKLSKRYNDILSVPQEATVEMQDKVFVYVVDATNKVSRQPIHIVGTSQGNYLIGDGLKAGDRIVYKGMDLLRDGEAIKPQDTPIDSLKIASIK